MAELALKVLFLSPVFSPSKGGIETVTAQVAEGVKNRGCQVIVATDSPSDPSEGPSISVVRQPTGEKLRELFEWADVIWHHQPCFGMLLRAKQLPNNMGVTVHTWLPSGFTGFVRRRILRSFRVRFGVSEAIAAHVPKPSGVLPNSYDPSIFHCRDGASHRVLGKLGCVARLVSDKGVDQLLKAISFLRNQDLKISCTIVGEGPELTHLRELAVQLDLQGTVEFLPFLPAPELADFYRSCAYSVVPSRWKEPFGLVALESIACGTPVIAANHGGLPEAVGNCGMLFSPGNAEALAERIKVCVGGGEDMHRELLKDRVAQLSKFEPNKQADAYMEAFKLITADYQV